MAAILVACSGLLSAIPQPVAAAPIVALPSSVRAVAPGGTTTDPTCGQYTDSDLGWINPCNLQFALSLARDAGSPIQEIWIKAGTYQPATSDRNGSFNIRSGLAVFGGFAGRESLRSQRIATPTDGNSNNDYFTLLTGEIQQDSIDTNNSYHVVTIDHATAVTILDRLIITKGYASGSSTEDYGGGLHINASKVYLSNSKINDNQANKDGAGIYVDNNSQVSVVFTELTENLAARNGGGIYAENSDVTLLNDIFYENSGNNGKGAYAGVSGSLTIANTIFYANPGTGQAIDLQTGSGNQLVAISYSIVQGGCGTGQNNLSCTSVSTTADPGIVVSNGADGIADTPDDILSLPASSPYFSILSTALAPADIYDVDGDGITSETAYSAGGAPPFPPKPTAVTVYDFSAAPEADGIQLSWESATEINNIGFNLYRSTADGLEFSQLNPTLIESKSPGGLLGASYTFFDSVDTGHSYVYRLQALDVDGSMQFFPLLYRPATSAGSSGLRLFLPLLSQH